MAKRTSLPIIRKDKSPSSIQTSKQHLDMLFNAMLLIINLHPFKYAEALISALTFAHNSLILTLDREPAAAIAMFKMLRVWWMQYLRGYNLSQGNFHFSEWDPINACPRLLQPLVAWNMSCVADGKCDKKDLIRGRQVAACYLDGSRVIVCPTSPNTNTITAKSTATGTVAIPNLEAALEQLGITPEAFLAVYESKCASFKYPIITTAGPNGQATWSAGADTMAILKDTDLFLAMLHFAKFSKLDHIISNMTGCIEAPDELTGRKNKELEPVTGRIHAIDEWGGKCRIVAILDYWTQALLSPLHDTIAHFLSKLPMDGTFNQDAIIRQVKEWTKGSGQGLYSYDLTAATDRLPIELQKDILVHLFKDTHAGKHWRAIMATRTFLDLDMKSDIRYAVGQPMGAKSSFPMLGLLHHVIIQAAALKVDVKGYKDYVVLGDDNTHNNKGVAIQYKELMTSFGVEINESKSVVPYVRCLPAAEICKRVFISDYELTALPAKLIVKAAKYGHLAPDLQNELVKRGDPISESALINFFAGLLDKKSLQGLIILNSVPPSVSGLVRPIKIEAPNLDPVNWFEHKDLKYSDIVEAHTFALITEQLKRVDALLRGTVSISELLAHKVNLDPTMVYPSGLFSGMTPDEVEKKVESLPPITRSHPIVLASIHEMERVVDQLTALRAGTPEVVAAARRGLLDVLRNSLSDIWEGEVEKTNAVRRSIFNATMSALSRITSKKAGGVLSFSLLLTSVERMWSVHWVLGEPVRLNVVRTKVKISVTDAESNYAKALSELDMARARL